MHNLYVVLFFVVPQFVPAQTYFARFYTFPDGSGNTIRDIQLSGDSMLFRMNSADSNPTTVETRMATMLVNSNQFSEDVYLPNVEAGTSLVKDGGYYLLPSEDKNGLKHITLTRLDENFSFIDSVHLKLADGPNYYFVGKAILYNDQYIVTGTVQNSIGYAFSRTVIFILNKDLTLHDTRIIEPVRQFIRPLDLAINPVDGRLYISLIFDNFHPQDSTLVPALQYQKVVTLDSNFHLEDFWASDEYISSASAAAPIAFSETGTMYSFYTYSTFDHVVAVDPSGQISWKNPLDSFMVVGPTTLWLTTRDFSIQDISVASNGDILVAGSVVDTKYNIGWSSFLARLRPDGEIKWARIYRSNNRYSVQNYGYASGFTRVLELPGGSIVAGGAVLVFDPVLAPGVPPKQEAWLLRTDSNGCISPACGYIQDAVQKSNYFPIVHPDNEWTVEHHELFLTSRRKYRFSPDSVLMNGKYFYELTYDDSFLGSNATGRYYREENGIVYRSNGAVAFDLNLGAGDTLPSNQGANQGARTVLAVGTVIYADSLPRKTMTVHCAADTTAPPLTVVEGMGDLEDFFRSEVLCINPLDGPEDYLLCYSVDGEVVYMKPGENCDLSATTIPGKRKPVAVYPNPVVGQLYIDIPIDAAGPAYQVLIYNALGGLLLDQNCFVAGGLLSVDVSGLYPGSYWGVVRCEDGKMLPFMFVRIKD